MELCRSPAFGEASQQEISLEQVYLTSTRVSKDMGKWHTTPTDVLHFTAGLGGKGPTPCSPAMPQRLQDPKGE